MTNSSLKEQLQALSLGSTSSNEEKTKKKKNPAHVKASAPAAKQRPAWLEQALYGVELLKAHFPACFKEPKEIQPLKIGIKQDLVKRLSTCHEIVTSDKACMVNSLTYYVNSLAYHKNVVVGATRVDLDGQASGTVTEEEAKYSKERRHAKMEKKKSSRIPATETTV